jgi:putative peptidoglycan lipid II flippase
MERILKLFSKEYGNVNQAALLIGSFAFLSQILGLLRDRSIAHSIGPSSLLDAYYAAFRIPDLIFISIGSLFSVTILIPFILQKISGEEITPEAKTFFNNILTAFLVLMIFVSIVVFFFLPNLISFIVPGFSPIMQDKVVELSRIILLSPILLGLSNLFSTITQIFRKFFAYALGPVFYNLGIILGVFFLYPTFGINGLALGVILGAFLHFIIQFFISLRCGLSPKFSWPINLVELKEVILVSLPRTLGISFNSLTLIFIIAFASRLESGSISIFNFSLNLQSIPLSLVGLSYAVAAFPTLTKFQASEKIEEFKNHLRSVARQIIFWSLPATFLFIVLRAQIVRVILGSGSFSWENTRLVAASLALFSISIVAQGLVALFTRAYYAKGNTRRPLLTHFISFLTTIFLSFLFLHIFESNNFFKEMVELVLRVNNIPGTKILMLPLAYSFGSIINFCLLWFFLKKDFLKPGEKFISQTFFQSLIASFFMGLISYLSLNIFAPVFGNITFWAIFFQTLISSFLGILVGILVLFLLKSEELSDLIKALQSKFWKNKILTSSNEIL